MNFFYGAYYYFTCTFHRFINFHIFFHALIRAQHREIVGGVAYSRYISFIVDLHQLSCNHWVATRMGVM